MSPGPLPLPTIVIEDPEGIKHCEECDKKDAKVKNLCDDVTKVPSASCCKYFDNCYVILLDLPSAFLTICCLMFLNLNSLSYSQAKSDFEEYYSKTKKGFSETTTAVKDIKKVSNDVKNDLNWIKIEIDSFSSGIRDALDNIDTTKQAEHGVTMETTSTQTDQVPKTSRVLPTPGSKEQEPPKQEHQTPEYCEREARYKKDIFDLKVKLKELEVKMNHVKKRADEIKRDSGKGEVISENISQDKVGA